MSDLEDRCADLVAHKVHRAHWVTTAQWCDGVFPGVPEGFTLVSWARSRGGLSAVLTSTSAHVVRLGLRDGAPDDWSTLCGTDVPYVARPSTPRAQRSGGIHAAVYPDFYEETVQQSRCGRCARSRALREPRAFHRALEAAVARQERGS